MSARTIMLVVSIVSSGLAAGLLFGWLVSVIPGTRRVGDRTYVETMQTINVAIINPAFLIPFMLTPLFLGAAAFAQYRAGNVNRAWMLGAAAGTYLVGVLGVTIGRNIPLNDALDAFDLGGATDRDVADQRRSYEGPWNRWHAVRTVASVAVLALVAATPLMSEGD